MRPYRNGWSPAPRNRVDQVLSQARQAVETARAQRDQLQAELRIAQADNDALRRQLETRPASPPPRAPAVPADRSGRLAADLENLRRQQAAALAQARIDTLTEAVEPLAEILDHLGRALASRPDPDDPWFKGTAAILARTRSSLKALGVSTTGTEGDPFDPRQHDAIGAVQTTDVPHDTILDVVKTGLVLDDGTVVRPASVVVAQGGA